MKDYPMRMRPCYQDYLWGGIRLKTEFGKTDAPERAAESWELADHPAGSSRVAEGALAGKTLTELGELDRSRFWGTECTADFPLMVKLIDARKDLSIQVHPSDETAERSLGEQGKAEMWYIVDCAPKAFLYLGFSRRMNRAELLRRAEEGTICDCLNRVEVSPGDVYFILPGTIHAIGAGIMVAEIQQNSNSTFRVYDYKRRDAGGNLRPLHLSRAADVLNYEPLIPAECHANSGASFPAFTMAEMFSCGYFKAYRLDVHTAAALACDSKSFQHLLCVEGRGRIRCGGQAYQMGRGDSFFLPAALGNYLIEGACRVLLSRV